MSFGTGTSVTFTVYMTKYSNSVKMYLYRDAMVTTEVSNDFPAQAENS
jgi:hypothetical protein